jgi:hypothetical protein
MSALRTPLALARRCRERGQSMAEYLVGCAVAIAILAVPVGGSPSVVVFLLRAIRAAFARFLGAMSLPV